MRTWRAGGRRDVYADFNGLTLQITVGALFGTAVDRQQSRRVSGALTIPQYNHHPGRLLQAVVDQQWPPDLSTAPVGACCLRLAIAKVHWTLHTPRLKFTSDKRLFLAFLHAAKLLGCL